MPGSNLDVLFPPISVEQLLESAVRVDRFPIDAEIEELLLAEAKRRYDAATGPSPDDDEIDRLPARLTQRRQTNL